MRILLADNRVKVRFALSALLTQRSPLKVVGEAVDAHDLLEQASQSCPDIVLLDWRIACQVSDDLIAKVKEICPESHVIVLSGRPETKIPALSAGADFFVSKGEPPERLLNALAACSCGEPDTTMLNGGGHGPAGHTG
jgi:DNA-binding NarL/FixJ family response regulator